VRTVVQAWSAIAASVRGAAHARVGLPNQDAVRWSGRDGVTALALSDGHGSARCFRSDIGARLAVSTATRVLSSELASGRDVADLALIDRIACRLVAEWTLAARCDLRLFPFQRAEMLHLSEKTGAEARASVERHPLLAYGATLCAIAVTPTGLLYLQLGDGDIVTISASGKARRPLAADERLFGGETTSLCSPRAGQDVRAAFQRLDGTSGPALILVSTDGYANSFRDERGFLQVGPDLLAMLRAEGVGPVRECLPAWLEEASRLGSGDDVTVGLLYRDIPRSVA